jgi:hypothetical protein
MNYGVALSSGLLAATGPVAVWYTQKTNPTPGRV